MKILITGCRGQLGTELQKQLAAESCVLGPLPERLRKAEQEVSEALKEE